VASFESDDWQERKVRQGIVRLDVSHLPPSPSPSMMGPSKAPRASRGFAFGYWPLSITLSPFWEQRIVAFNFLLCRASDATNRRPAGLILYGGEAPSMCDQCQAINVTITYYRRQLAGVTDRTAAQIKLLIEDLESAKVRLHPGGE
jgi:hypothetical protein